MTAARRAESDAAPIEIGYYDSVYLRGSARVQRVFVAASLLAHLAYLGYLQAPLWLRKAAAAPPETRPHVRLIDPFEAERPPAHASGQAPPKLALPPAPTAVAEILPDEPPPHSIPAPEESKADMTKATLRIEDPHHEMPLVLARYQGYVGFGRANEREEYVRRVFSAVTRAAIPLADGIASLDTFKSLEIGGSGYPLFDDLRRQNRLDDFIAYALFPAFFDEEILHTIRKAAVARFGGGKITSATIIFSATTENGIEAGKIEVAGGSQ